MFDNILLKKLIILIDCKVVYYLFNMNPYCTHHNTCIHLASNNAKKAAVAVLLLNHQKYGFVVMLGKERGGKYAEQYNLPGGKGDSNDLNTDLQFCWLKCIIRELHEEFGIHVPFRDNIFNSLFRSYDGSHIRVIIHKDTPVFIGVLPIGTSRQSINSNIQKNRNNPALGPEYREIINVDNFYLLNGKQVEGKDCEISSFARQVIKRIENLQL